MQFVPDVLDFLYDADTLGRSNELMRSCTGQLCNNFDAPKILPGPDDSIDLHWKTPQRELLINVPKELDKPVRYYGDNHHGQTVKGSLDSSANNQWLMLWLMQDGDFTRAPVGMPFSQIEPYSPIGVLTSGSTSTKATEALW